MDKLKKIVRILLGLLIIIQVCVPVYIIASNEIRLARGEVFKFRVAPVDPYDPFRGRYIILQALDTEIQIATTLNIGDTVYATFDKSGGYARINDIRKDKPETDAYLAVKIQNIIETDGIQTVSIIYPFDRIYMNEKIAPLVDTAFRSFQGTVFLEVAVKQGQAIIQHLYFDGIEAEAFVSK